MNPQKVAPSLVRTWEGNVLKWKKIGSERLILQQEVVVQLQLSKSFLFFLVQIANRTAQAELCVGEQQ